LLFQFIRLAGATSACDVGRCIAGRGGGAKAEIARVQGTAEPRQELYKVAVRADGGAVREDDAEAGPLDADDMVLGDGEQVVATWR
jgi:hypothetical protein